MNPSTFAYTTLILTPSLLMLVCALLARFSHLHLQKLWHGLVFFSGLATVGVILSMLILPNNFMQFGLKASSIALIMALLVQFLGTVIAAFSSRYLEGEANQSQYISALALVLGTVQLLLLADHWLLLIFSWALVGIVLERLLCFYADRPFALLAAHKKNIADRLADILLVSAAALAWHEVDSGSLSTLASHLQQHGTSTLLQMSAICLVLAVILRTALLPVHGWLIQVMEAPTPVSALLHAGVVNLGGVVLIRFSSLLEHSIVARYLLLIFGLATAILAGMVMLTRISIKVRLAWSTLAQMGFMILECGLGLYTLAALHLFGHSLYKAYAFLFASSVVRQTRLQMLHSESGFYPLSLYLAPAISIALVLLLQTLINLSSWPWWWSSILGFAWAPLLWMPMHLNFFASSRLAFSALSLVIVLTLMMIFAHALPLGLQDHPNKVLGIFSLIGMGLLYCSLLILQQYPKALIAWRRWSYAGFYIDEFYTRLALMIWPTRWNPSSANNKFPNTK